MGRDLRLRLRDEGIGRGERRLYRAAWWHLTLVAPAVRTLGMMWCRRALRRWSRRPSFGPASTTDAVRIGEIVRWAGRRVPFQVDCLEVSLVTACLLDRAGISNDLRLGTRFSSSGLEGHAWVEVDGKVVSERHDPRRRFVPFARRVPDRRGESNA